jgi:hypothetical protein
MVSRANGRRIVSKTTRMSDESRTFAQDAPPVPSGAGREPAVQDTSVQEPYEAILEAVMETERGRWFLAEYARRNRNADSTLLLAAIDRLEAAILRRQEDEAGTTTQPIGTAAAPAADAHEKAESQLPPPSAPPAAERRLIADLARLLLAAREALATRRPGRNGGDADFALIAPILQTETARVRRRAARIHGMAIRLRENLGKLQSDALVTMANEIADACTAIEGARDDVAAMGTLLRECERRLADFAQNTMPAPADGDDDADAATNATAVATTTTTIIAPGTSANSETSAGPSGEAKGGFDPALSDGGASVSAPSADDWLVALAPPLTVEVAAGEVEAETGRTVVDETLAAQGETAVLYVVEQVTSEYRVIAEPAAAEYTAEAQRASPALAGPAEFLLEPWPPSPAAADATRTVEDEAQKEEPVSSPSQATPQATPPAIDPLAVLDALSDEEKLALFG